MQEQKSTLLTTLQTVGDRIQIAMIVGSVPTDGSGEIYVQYANTSAAILFNYPSGAILENMDIRELMPAATKREHTSIVKRHLNKGEPSHRSNVMGSWRKLEAVRKDGRSVPILFNVARIKQDDEHYFVAFFLDRTKDVARETELADAVEAANLARDDAENMRQLAEEARSAAEDGMLRQKRLTGQITLLRQVFSATVGLVVMLGALVLVQWSLGGEVEGLSMVKDVLLVLTGILGSAMASVFDSRNTEN